MRELPVDARGRHIGAGGPMTPAAPPALVELVCWRHPRCAAAAGRCIGQTDLPLDRRRAKRLAHRIRAAARRRRWPRRVWTSPLQRSRNVGRWLRRWGWQVHVDARLAELHFGRWEGRPWPAIAHEEIEAWTRSFARCAPGGGESLQALIGRVRDFIAHASPAALQPLLVVAHAGWMQALQCLLDGTIASAAQWPAPPAHGERRHCNLTLPLAQEMPDDR